MAYRRATSPNENLDRECRRRYRPREESSFGVDLSGVLSAENGTLVRRRRVRIDPIVPRFTSDVFRLLNATMSEEPREIEVLEARDVPGFFVLRNFLSLQQQAAWALRACAEFSQGEWNNVAYALCRDHNCADVDTSNLWHNYVYRTEAKGMRRMAKLRWCNRGYNYDWTERRYKIPKCSDAETLVDPRADGCDDLVPSSIDSDLEALARSIATCVDTQLEPHAGIVNFYGPAARLGGHCDDAEKSPSALVSLSIGCSCVFLVSEGSSADDTPHAILLRSGDVVVQSGTARQARHAVPSVFPLTTPSNTLDAVSRLLGELDTETSQAHARALCNYLKTHRINVNARQVY